jgi:hypothetical protein
MGSSCRHWAGGLQAATCTGYASFQQLWAWAGTLCNMLFQGVQTQVKPTRTQYSHSETMKQTSANHSAAAHTTHPAADWGGVSIKGTPLSADPQASSSLRPLVQASGAASMCFTSHTALRPPQKGFVICGSIAHGWRFIQWHGAGIMRGHDELLAGRSDLQQAAPLAAAMQLGTANRGGSSAHLAQLNRWSMGSGCSCLRVKQICIVLQYVASSCQPHAPHRRADLLGFRHRVHGDCHPLHLRESVGLDRACVVDWP